jgi:formylglycine-generating enzyme required for sulfatase activity
MGGKEGSAGIDNGRFFFTIRRSPTRPPKRGQAYWLGQKEEAMMEITFPTMRFRDRFEERRLKPMSDAEYDRWLEGLEQTRADYRSRLNTGEYERADLAWYHHAFVENFCFMWDKDFYDPATGYRIDEYLDRGEREFGGYDILVLWHAYPRIGCDDRNQFDCYRDMPGGLVGLRGVVRRAHERGVKVFIDYNPWDTGTRREEKTDAEVLAEIVAAIDADGIFLDTMSASDPGLRKTIDKARSGVVFETEGSPSMDSAEVVTGSWASYSKVLGRRFFWVRELPFPWGTVLTLRWLEPRHSGRAVDRSTHHRYEQIVPAFFNGCGVVVWENVFGWWNPWTAEDRDLCRRAVRILKSFKTLFSTPDWAPLVPTLHPQVLANRWSLGDTRIWTLANLSFQTVDEAILSVDEGDEAAEGGIHYLDAWNDIEMVPERNDGRACLRVRIEPRSAGCIVAKRGGRPELEPQRAGATSTYDDPTLASHRPRPVDATPAAISGGDRGGLAQVPAGSFVWRVEHRQREGACYDEISHNWAYQHPERRVDMKGFSIDRYPVTNGDFREFLEATDYRPKIAANFLKHWTDGQIPEAKEKHPVVYVDIEDARAFAAWAGKRLPREEEWQYAAQGEDGRFWPWGGRFDAARCNAESADTTPVDRYPEGQSPFGVWDLAGNVWEMTESERDDGHTRYIVLKGGSHYRARGSIWYFDGGAQRCTWHAKFPLLWPGLDRCATIGFRCVVDE